MPPPPPVADRALAHSDHVETIVRDALAAVDTSRINGDPNQWRDAVVDAGSNLLALQEAGVALAPAFVAEVLDAQGADPAVDAELVSSAFVDLTDGGGSWLRNLVYAPPSAYKDAVGSGGGATLARTRAAYVATAIVTDGIRDTARAATSTALVASRNGRGYVRALRGKSCARCAILAGRRYRVSAFRRHPRCCDCYMIPSAEDSPGDWTTDPAVYFRSLSHAEQDSLFTKSGAEAIRQGADLSQVVNAHDGITTVTSFGRQVEATTTGTTTRGLAGQRLAAERGTVRDASNRRAVAPRLMPDEIFQLAESGGWTRDQLLEQLRRFAYIV